MDSELTNRGQREARVDEQLCTEPICARHRRGADYRSKPMTIIPPANIVVMTLRDSRF